jgi:hypothetical protein
MVTDAGAWDTRFTLVEVFNDSGWRSNRDGTVRDWLGLLKAGRKIFAVGSSDSHSITSSPVGYPRTCMQVGTDDPRALTPNGVRDALAAGHSTISGGIYVTARVGTAGPGDTVTGLGPSSMVAVEVQAAPWVDVDAIDWWSTARPSTPSRSCRATPTRPTRPCGGAACSRSTCAPTAAASWWSPPTAIAPSSRSTPAARRSA